MKKKKFYLFSLLSILTITLTACDFSPFGFLSNFFNNDSYGNESYDPGSYSVNTKDSDSPFQSIPNYEPVKEDVDYTYKDLANHNLYSTDTMPSKGDVNILVIPVWFSDSTNAISTGSSLTKKSKDQVRRDIRNAFFGSGDEVSWRSVKTYYHEASFGKLNIGGAVTGWYEPNNRASYYTNSNVTINLLKDAVAWAKRTYGSQIDFREYDADNNGYLDCVCLIYGYHNSNYQEGFSFWTRPTKGNDNLWAYTFWAQDVNLQDKTNPGVNTFLWASYDFMYPEYAGGANTTPGLPDAHTYIHELGHCMGLEDYYDYNNNPTCPAGAFSMQDYNIGGHDPYSRMALGWVNPYVPIGDCDITISSFESSGDIIVLSPNYVKSPFDEYIILELYTPSGLNAFDTANAWNNQYPRGALIPGIRIWHVDSRLLEYKTYPRYENEGYVISKTINNRYYYSLGLSNTTYSTASADYCSICPALRQYSLLYLVRNSSTFSYPAREKSFFNSGDLFLENDTFTLNSFSNQFVNRTTLDNGQNLPFRVTVKSVDDNSATIGIEVI